ncbi:unnamed protein product [Lactuca virosa]|uniref:Uncharacterized protein n=1 Tax=Lactuca virosa TaxID=75947 RepID=A0AAU9NK44_9ASTR|nr:unnamed protein product [Lactuca virosa]
MDIKNCITINKWGLFLDVKCKHKKSSRGFFGIDVTTDRKIWTVHINLLNNITPSTPKFQTPLSLFSRTHPTQVFTISISFPICLLADL